MNCICRRATRFGFVFASMLLMLMLMGCRADGVVRSTASFPAGTGFTQHFVAVDNEVRGFWVFVPRDYTPSKHYPTILFLHGLFEAGKDNKQCLAGGLAPVIAKHPEKWPFITIFPQSDGTWRGDSRDHLAIATLDFAQHRWSIDADRVILAGLSYGGLGTWQIGAKHPDRFAALVPVSGFSDKQITRQLKNLPVWAFDYHGDPFVNSTNSQQMCEQIKSEGGHAQLKEFTGVGHDCWDRAISESALVPWMLLQRRQVIAIHTSDATVAT